MDKKQYITPIMQVINIQTCGMIATSLDEKDKKVDMKWSGEQDDDSDPDEIGENSTYYSF